MKNWTGYIRDHIDSGLWGFILLDYYYWKKDKGYRGGPSQFIDEVLCELPKNVADIAAFHHTLLSVCVHLFGVDFSDTIGKSIRLLESTTPEPTKAQLESIIAQYGTYGKEELFREKLAVATLRIPETRLKPTKVEGKEDPILEAVLLAIEEARKCRPEDERIHPKVGAVIVKGKQIVCSAHRGEIRPGEHAEYTALVRKGENADLRGATLVTTLEPCTTRNHKKKPCVLHIVESGVKKVIVGMIDPNREIRGKGILFLQDHSIGVELFPSEYYDEVRKLNSEFWDEATKGIKIKITDDVSLEEHKKGRTGHPPASLLTYEELPAGLVKDPFGQAYLLRYYSRSHDLRNRKPFEGARVFFALHFLKDLIPFVKAAEELGLNMSKSCFFYKDYPYPQREAIGKWLEGEEATTESWKCIGKHLERLTSTISDGAERVLIVEDGGFFVPAIHREYPQLLPRVMGAVEQTSRGIRNDTGVGELRLPVISVATSKLKSDFEPPYIAQAAIDNLQRMVPDIAIRGKKVALFGCGTIGREIAQWLRTNGVNVTVFDSSPESKLWATQRGFAVADSPAQAAHGKQFVIGASGERSITSESIAALSHGTYLLSVSSDLHEIDVDELEQQQVKTAPLRDKTGTHIIGTDFTLPPDDRIVHLLANGYPINFWGFDSMPDEASDLILSLILLCAVELALGNYVVPGIDADAVNKIAKKYKLAEKFLEFHSQG